MSNESLPRKTYRMPTEEEWIAHVIKDMTSQGWVNDRNTETHIGFSYKIGDKYWIRDFDKKTRSFVHFNGNQVVSLLVRKENER